jgi:pimeloyl-ACP methyl ester carboxylesterase
MAEWVDAYTSANGIKIHYHRTGGDFPPILLLHGITDNGLCWGRVARDLRERYDIIMTDARGHGSSDGISGAFSVPILADDAAGVLQGLGLEKTIVWGHSMGAITAATLAANYPELVKAVILEDPPLDADFKSLPPEIREGFKRDNLMVKSMSPEGRLAWALKQNPGWDRAEIGPWIESKVQVDPGILDQFGKFHDDPWQDVIKRIQCPGLLLTADPEKGAIVKPETAKQVVELWRQGEVVKIAGAGHCIHRDKYDESMQVVMDFLARLE